MKLLVVLISFFFSFFVYAQSLPLYKTGLVIPKDWKSRAHFENLRSERVLLPAKFDWRDVKALSPIRDQGSCGSCWSFSITATVEDLFRLTSGSDLLSTQYLVSCNDFGFGCNGGFFDAFDMLVSPGSVTESQFPYVAKDVACKSNLKYGEKILSWAYVKSDSEVPPVEDIKKAIYLYGPVAVAVAADNSFSGYTGGVHKTCNSSGINHAVNLVGWSDEDGGYWIMRNSWGEQWGDKGYMKIKYGCNKIGYAASFAKYKQTPTPNPDPDPTPEPTPEPTPPPPPPPPTRSFPRPLNRLQMSLMSLSPLISFEQSAFDRPVI